MKPFDIKKTYEEIFKAYNNPSIENHIQKIIELDAYLPYSSTFFCITNTQKLTFEYISKNFKSCLGLDSKVLLEKGMQYFWGRIHPEDIEQWLESLNQLMHFTLTEIPVGSRKLMSYTWNYRFKNSDDQYVNIIQNTTPLEFDSEMKPVIGLAHYTVIDPRLEFPISASAKLLNAQNEYETIYFNSFSQKLLSNGITNRELDVIRLLVLKKTSKEIAEKLSISPNTVDTHRRNILKKLNLGSTGELIGMIKMNKNLL